MAGDMLDAPDVAIRRQELHCHNCGRYVQFDIDLGLNGRHVLNCPNCGHEHCRVVRDGEITDERWAQRNGWSPQQTFVVPPANVSSTAISTWISYNSTSDSTAGAGYLYGAWVNAGS